MLRAVVKEVTESNRRVILVIDEVHTLVGAGSGGGAEGGGIDAANLLKPALARGELQCIGATTIDEYRKYIERDPALERLPHCLQYRLSEIEFAVKMRYSYG